MKKFLIAILIILSTALLFGCNNKNATLVSAQKVGTKGNFDVYQLTYSNGFESLIEVGDNTVIESISVLNGGIVYNYYNSGNTTNDDELPRKEVSTNKDEASDKTEESNGKEESTNNNSIISGTLPDGTVIFNNNIATLQPVIKYEGVFNLDTISPSISFAQMITIIPACEHSFGEYTHVKDATCSMYGQDVATCSKCDCTLTYYTAKLEHDYDTEIVHTYQPTCTKEGYECYKCKNCLSQQKICILEKSDEHVFKDGFCAYCKKSEDEVKD